MRWSRISKFRPFLFLKWKKLRVFFFMMMALYIVYTLSLTTLAVSFYVLKTKSTIINSCIALSRSSLFISLIIIIIREVQQAARMLQRDYFQDLESWVKWSSFLLSTLVVVGNHPADWLVHVSAIAVLLSWLELLFLLSRWPSSLGFYILMFFTVAKNLLKVMATFIFVILGFMFAFMVHFRGSGHFSDWWRSFVKVMVMSIELDYVTIFKEEDGLNDIVGRGILLLFMILVATVLMNLLVGVTVSDIANLEKKGRAERMAKQIDFLSMIEKLVVDKHVLSWCQKRIGLAEYTRKCRSVGRNLTIKPGIPSSQRHLIIPESQEKYLIKYIAERSKKARRGSSIIK